MHGLSKFFLKAKPDAHSEPTTNNTTQKRVDLVQSSPAGTRKNQQEHQDRQRLLRSAPSMMQDITEFEQLNLLGSGTFGRVHRVRSKNTHEEFAMKVLRKSFIIQLKQVEHLKNEKNILQSVNHPFIIKLYKTFVDKRNVYLLMEISTGGEFFALLRTLGRLSKEVAKFYAAEMVLVLEHLHSNGIVYRDLKPENVLLDNEGHIKICDFGFAKKVQDRTWTLCGTPEYLAPEVIMGSGHDKAVDWWALGVLVYEMLAGYPPFFGEHPFEIYEKICEGLYKFPAHFDDEMKDLITRLLTPSKSRRLGNLHNGTADVKSHAFFTGVHWEALLAKEIPPPLSPEALLQTKNYRPDNQEDDPEYDLQPVAEEAEDTYGPIFKDFENT